jgi:dTDP-4-dehydrorhamnose reductase
MRLLVTGASGLLGLHLALAAAETHAVVAQAHTHPLHGVPFEVICTDLATPEAVQRLLDAAQPEAVIHCAALAFPDRCEENPALSELVNAALPGWLAQACVNAGVRLVHVSTDAVFDGARGNFSEDAPPNPLNTYARHKLAGERSVAEIDPGALIVRSVFYGWSLNGRRSLAEWFYNNLAAGTAIHGFTDAYFCPLIAGDLGRLMLLALERGLSGTYHIASAEAISKYDFGVAIARLFGFDERLIGPASVADSGLRANRSADLSLNTDKFAAALGAALPGQMPGLWQFLRQQQDGTAQQIREMGGA